MYNGRVEGIFIDTDRYPLWIADKLRKWSFLAIVQVQRNKHRRVPSQLLDGGLRILIFF